jgi:phosphoribosyl-ATP pyrophosphohydrolase
MIKIPYDRLTLLSEMLSIPKDLLTEELSKKCNSVCAYTNDKNKLNKKVAEINGISVELLINSINYEKLIQEYNDSICYELIKTLQKNGLSNKQSWALFAAAKDLL